MLFDLADLIYPYNFRSTKQDKNDMLLCLYVISFIIFSHNWKAFGTILFSENLCLKQSTHLSFTRKNLESESECKS